MYLSRRPGRRDDWTLDTPIAASKRSPSQLSTAAASVLSRALPAQHRRVVRGDRAPAKLLGFPIIPPAVSVPRARADGLARPY